MKVEVIRPVKVRGNAVLVRRDDGRYFVVSTVVARDTGKMETLAFGADANGKVSTSAGGGMGMTRRQVIRHLAADDLAEHLVELTSGLPRGAP